ncbi:hypothetical protein CHELA40_13447 [Chelatococcus asaccharovorans]|nr:hypothetical protein CHELA40_13447 [Chelatococcus asaccharovorans]CAH1677962.1 hypothetical protein CHELA17_62174 [Chelatococcus asaccharovorans]
MLARPQRRFAHTDAGYADIAGVNRPGFAGGYLV